MILMSKRPLGTIKANVDAYPTGADAQNEGICKVWELKAKGQREEYMAAKKGQQDMITVILGQCDDPT